MKKFHVNKVVRTADSKNRFWKRHTINWSDNLYKITEFINDIKPIYKIDQLSERYNESLLKKTKLPLNENKGVMKEMNLN